MRTWCSALSCSSVNSSGCVSGKLSSPSYATHQYIAPCAHSISLMRAGPTERAVSTNAAQLSLGRKRRMKSRFSGASRTTSSTSENTRGKLSFVQLPGVDVSQRPSSVSTCRRGKPRPVVNQSSSRHAKGASHRRRRGLKGIESDERRPQRQRNVSSLTHGRDMSACCG
jgi:hypothetical protein